MLAITVCFQAKKNDVKCCNQITTKAGFSNSSAMSASAGLGPAAFSGNQTFNFCIFGSWLDHIPPTNEAPMWLRFGFYKIHYTWVLREPNHKYTDQHNELQVSIVTRNPTSVKTTGTPTGVQRCPCIWRCTAVEQHFRIFSILHSGRYFR